VQAAIEGARGLIGADAVRIWLREGEDLTLKLLACSEPSPVGDHLPLERSLAGRVVQTGQAQRIVRDTSASSRLSRGQLAEIEQQDDWLGAPFSLAEPGRADGVIVALRSARRPFSNDEQEALSTLATGVGIALHTVRLYDAIARADQELRDAASLTAIGMVTSSIIHDFAQPITAAVAMLEVLTSEEPLSAHGMEIARRMSRSLHRVGETATHLRRLARRSTAKLLPVDIHQVLDDALSLVEHELRHLGIDVNKRYQAQLPRVWGNADALERVFVNLFSNARDAMDGRSGSVTITTRVGRSQRTRRYIELIVEDKGPGLPDRHPDQIFQPLFTTKDAGHGVGLGLSLSRRIVEQHGGRIEAVNAPGGGARFTVLLPRKGPAQDERSGRGARSRGEGGARQDDL
jgi:signal transduction histidine kinase